MRDCKNCACNNKSGNCDLLERETDTLSMTKDNFQIEYCDNCGYNEHGCSITSGRVCVHSNIVSVNEEADGSLTVVEVIV